MGGPFEARTPQRRPRRTPAAANDEDVIPAMARPRPAWFAGEIWPDGDVCRRLVVVCDRSLYTCERFPDTGRRGDCGDRCLGLGWFLCRGRAGVGRSRQWGPWRLDWRRSDRAVSRSHSWEMSRRVLAWSAFDHRKPSRMPMGPVSGRRNRYSSASPHRSLCSWAEPVLHWRDTAWLS